MAKAKNIKWLIFFLSLPGLCYCQNAPKNAKTIVIKNVSFLQVCNALLDSGYTIEKKDNDLQTAKTELREYDKYWNAYYSINIRVKDSIVYISGLLTGPGKTGGLFKDEPITNQVNKKGETLYKSLFGYAFLKLYNFAQSFKKEIEFQ